MKKVIGLMFSLVAVVMLASSAIDAGAQTQGGAGGLTVFLGTSSTASETLMVGTGVNGARSGSVLGSVIIGSSTAGNSIITLYDSGDTSTVGKYVIGTFSCSAPGVFRLDQAVANGLLLVNTGCKALITYLTHR